MQVVNKSILLKEFDKMAEKMFSRLVKAVIDVEQGVMAIDAPFHADLEALLLENGSKQENLWGINIYPDKVGLEEFIEFDSMINIRPGQGNRSRSVDNPRIREMIKEIVDKRVIL